MSTTCKEPLRSCVCFVNFIFLWFREGGSGERSMEQAPPGAWDSTPAEPHHPRPPITTMTSPSGEKGEGSEEGRHRGNKHVGRCSPSPIPREM